ncbi:hypothetical protein RI129_006196 [Pyrocoelia pectoralis]|uniref:Uncharacterized protein n=1 Tax=Pyrocoelia pectoralis TaxID=417401 RepID=A0AAN7VGT7_9COLE
MTSRSKSILAAALKNYNAQTNADTMVPATSGLGLCTESDSDAEPFSPDVSEYSPSSESDDTDADANEVLDGMEETPTRTKQPRKRLRQPEKWKRNISKIKRQHGEAYISSRKKFVPGACMRDACTLTCRKKCYQKFSYEERLSIFRRYYDLETYERKRDFIHTNTEKIDKKVATQQASRRNFTVIFYLRKEKTNEKVKVCKTMFLNTFGIRKGVVDIAMTKRTKENTSESDKRGRHIKKQTTHEIVSSVRNHIESFPVVESHYCRSDSKRKYLDPSLNINVMYEMDKQSRQEHNLDVAKPCAYRKIFSEEYNLGFHRPKKDQCRIYWKSYVDSTLTVRKEDINGEAVSWQKMCWLNFTKERPFVIRFKQKNFKEEFRSLDCTKRTRNKSDFRVVERKPLYVEALPISKEKYIDLNSLFTSVPPAISSEYKSFYENIPHKENTKSKKLQESQGSGSESD